MSRSPLLPIFLTVFVDVLGLTLVLPLLPFYAEHFKATPLIVGVLMASYAVCQLVSGPILGRTSDRVGRKPVLLVSQMGTCVGFVILGLANSLWMLFLGRIIDGLTAGNLSIAQAYISDVTKPEERTKAFGFIGIAFGTGFLIGPAISGPLAHRFGYGAPALGAAVLSLISILVTWRFLPKVQNASASKSKSFTTSQIQTFQRFFQQPHPRHRLLTFFAYTLSFSTLIGGLALYLERRFHFNVEHTGYIFAYSGFIGAIVQGGLIGRLVKRFGESRLALIGFICMMLGYVCLGAAYTLPVLLSLSAIASFGSAVGRPCLTTLLTRSAGRHEQGAILGVNQSLNSLSQIIGPLTAGWLIGNPWLGDRGLVAYGLAAGAFALVGAVLSSRNIPVDPIEV